jgi:lactate racemase
MQVAVEFQDERLDLDVPEGRLLGYWRGPRGMPSSEVAGFLDAILERPFDFPPLRQAIVPGDRVVIALGDDVPEAPAVLASLWRVLETAAVEAEALTVLSLSPARPELSGSLPGGVTFLTHDPEDRNNLAYLAATTPGRRVYLNRALTDADFVLPVGRLAQDPVLGAQGPWSTIFPGLSDAEALRELRAGADKRAVREGVFQESLEVNWLLGSQFQLGLIAGVTGLIGAVAGLGEKLATEGLRAVDHDWTFKIESRAELVVAGVGRPGQPVGIDDVARALANALKMVQHGGKIVVLSRAEGPIGHSVRRLIEAGDRRTAAAVLKGCETDPDHATARLFAKAVDWADVYWLSALSSDDVDGLSVVPLDRPEEARRLVAVSASTLVVSHADLMRAEVADETS